MTRKVLTAAAIILLGVSLSACFGKSHKSGPTAVVVVPPPPTPTFEAQFGSGFAAAFAASANAEPLAIANVDLLPLNPTAEPVALPR